MTASGVHEDTHRFLLSSYPYQPPPSPPPHFYYHGPNGSLLLFLPSVSRGKHVRPNQRVLNEYRGPGFLVSPSPSPVSKFSLFLSLTECRRWSLLTGECVGEELNHTTARKPGPLYIIQYSLVPTDKLKAANIFIYINLTT